MTIKSPWDERYAGEAFMYGTEPNDLLRERVGMLPAGGQVLCLAEGEGRNGVFLASKSFRVTGVDQSKVGLDKAQKLAKERGVEITTIVANLLEYELGEARWDAIVSIWCHMPPADRENLHPRLVRALRPGGVVLFEHYHPRQLGYGTGGPPDPSMMLTLEELRGAFWGWKVLHSFEGEREVHEGRGHTGKSFVTQWVAQKTQ